MTDILYIFHVLHNYITKQTVLYVFITLQSHYIIIIITEGYSTKKKLLLIIRYAFFECTMTIVEI